MSKKILNWHVYVVRCADDSLYCGISTDVAARIEKHNAGKGAKYVRGRLPVLLEASWIAGSKSAALREELLFKKLKKTQKEKKLKEMR
tara:strand:+ start:2221 stop:2484 length:264 start_codon:yes stop_codon:yes gene_type:complete